jgi:oxepin-CoA hydrolase/3-oxo-5,6-dehydrosuberyl-CoA semialdehyde dehydrogenase
MKTLRSYVLGRWHEASSGFTDLINPATEETCARAASDGIDFGAVLAYAHERGGPALRALSFAQRGQLLKEMSRVLRERRAELLELSRINSGTTLPDGAFDVDGATGVLAWYAGFSRTLGESQYLREDEGVPLAKGGGFWARHVLIPRRGAAVLINAFNFPAWGFAEKAACALLAGMPLIVKPATATALLTEHCIELLVNAGILPDGALQLICGATGDLLERLGPQDVLAFTGSATTARSLVQKPNLTAANTRINIEADSLNAAVLAPGATSEAFDMFVRDVVREMTQKAGQKCTAVRRIFVPAAAASTVADALVARLSEVVTGNPADAAITMGPVATRAQLEDALAGIAELRGGSALLHGSGQRASGRGSPAGRGFFIEPTLLRADDARAATAVHEREVFGPVATLLHHDGSPEDAAALVRLGGGMLVTSVYSDDAGWLGRFVAEAGSDAGRIYIGSHGSAADAPGSGAVYPQAQHGGPGRAGGGAELGALVGLRLYLQRVALQGERALLDTIVDGHA